MVTMFKGTFNSHNNFIIGAIDPIRNIVLFCQILDLDYQFGDVVCDWPIFTAAPASCNHGSDLRILSQG